MEQKDSATFKNEGMIDKEILAYDKQLLQAWLAWEAGSSNPDYFGAHKGTLGLELQQVPEEYSRLLCWFREQKFESYLELGVGRGGSFLLNVMFQSNLKWAFAIDNSEYWKDDQKKSILEKVYWLVEERKDAHIHFGDATTDLFFKDVAQETHPCRQFDCIFIDADHSYEGVKKDYDNALKHIKNGGYIIFHDINSSSCPGVMKIWEEASKQQQVEATFIHGNNCGIGIIQVGLLAQRLLADTEVVSQNQKTSFPKDLILLTAIESMMLNKSKYGVLLIETRPEINLEEVAERHTKFLPESWGLTIIGSKENEQVSCAALNRIHLNANGFNISMLNKWLTSSYFWSLIPHEKVLIIQPDSQLLRTGIEEFLQYDYVGAPWKFAEHGGNGGLSLRTVNIMKRICEANQYRGEALDGNEDIFFSNIMFHMKMGNLAPREVCEKFSCETIFKLGTLGVHAIEKYLTKEQCETILNQYK